MKTKLSQGDLQGTSVRGDYGPHAAACTRHPGTQEDGGRGEGASEGGLGLAHHHDSQERKPTGRGDGPVPSERPVTE